MRRSHASIIINNYNYAQYVAAAVESALAQTIPVEVVVVDDGSTDQSPAILRGYGNQIQLIEQSQRGQAAAMNAGMAASTGDVVFFLDSDDLMDPKKVESLLGVLEETSKADWVRHNLRAVLEPDGTVIAEQYYPLRVDSDPWLEVAAQGNAAGTTSALGFRRSLLEKIGPIPIGTYTRHADSFLKTAASLLGEVVTVTETLGTRRLHPGQVTSHDWNRFDKVPFYLELADAVGSDIARLAELHGLRDPAARGELWWQAKARYELAKLNGRPYRQDLVVAARMVLGAKSINGLPKRLGLAARLVVLAAMPREAFVKAWWVTHFGRQAALARLREGVRPQSR